MNDDNEHAKKIENIQGVLESIKKREGIIGYILRGSESAFVDLTDSSKVIEYAILSAKLLESGEQLSREFGLDKADINVLTSKDVKMLAFAINDIRVSVFMEKRVDEHKIHEDILHPDVLKVIAD